MAEVLAALDAALTAHGLARSVLGTLATVRQKADEPALAQAADRLGLPFFVADEKQVAAVAAKVMTTSTASLVATGAGSASEAAALAVSGANGRLFGPRIVCGPVTCALAEVPLAEGYP